MDIFDELEAWLSSMEAALESKGFIAKIERSEIDRPNPSINLNLRRGDYEVDILIWESGEAAWVSGETEESVTSVHFDDVRREEGLADLLSRLTDSMAVVPGKVHPPRRHI
jgi:hypothetical protein